MKKTIKDFVVNLLALRARYIKWYTRFLSMPEKTDKKKPTEDTKKASLDKEQPESTAKGKNQKIGCLAVIIIIGVIAAAIYYSNPDIGAHVVARQSIIEHYPMDSKVYVENTCNWRWTKDTVEKGKKASTDGISLFFFLAMDKQLKESSKDVFTLIEKVQVEDSFGKPAEELYVCAGVQDGKTIFLWPCSERSYQNCSLAFYCCLEGFRTDIGR